MKSDIELGTNNSEVKQHQQVTLGCIYDEIL